MMTQFTYCMNYSFKKDYIGYPRFKSASSFVMLMHNVCHITGAFSTLSQGEECSEPIPKVLTLEIQEDLMN